MKDIKTIQLSGDEYRSYQRGGGPSEMLTAEVVLAPDGTVIKNRLGPVTPDKPDVNQHLAQIEALADAYASDEGQAIVLARHVGVPKELAFKGLKVMRVSFILGALAATGLLVEGDVPEEWLKRNGVEM